MKCYFIYIIVLFSTFNTDIFCQESTIIGFYNCENLFDSLDAPLKHDGEYLTSSKKKWNTEKYLKKLKNLSKVILAMNNWKGPDILLSLIHI